METLFPQLAVGDWITMASRKWPDAKCFISPTEDLSDVSNFRFRTFYEANHRVTKLAHALDSLGLTKGDRVAILGVDSIEHMEVILACAKLGLTYCDLNYRLRDGEIANILKRSPVKAIFLDPRYFEVIDRIKESIPPTKHLFSLASSSAFQSTDELIEKETQESEIISIVRGEEILSIMFTSGTTSNPKGVLQSERMMRNIVYSFNREIRIQPGGRQYSGASLFHISGICSVLHALLAGRTSLILPQFDAKAVQSWLSNGQITSCTLIPTMISAILELPGATDASYPELQSILYGGSSMSPSLLRKMVSVFECDLYNGLGAGTEAGIQTMLYPEDHQKAFNGREELYSSIGKPILGVDLRLCDEEMNDVPPGEIGEIVTRSETIMSGYLDQPELTARSIVGGWFRAGDMARQDADGYLYLATRKSDMIIRGGENVYPVEIESTIADHPSVLEVAVIGIPEEHWGEIVGAAIVLRSGCKATKQEIQDLCRSRLASYKVPEHVQFFDDLPKNSTNKLVKSQIVELVIRNLKG
jgi:acyl-CoA synthetase (AMP-forming)/AMP-acid ligase II